MSNYKLKVSDFIYPREVPVRIITVTAAVLILLLVMWMNIYVGLFFFLNIGLLFFVLYQNMMTNLGNSVKVGPTQFERIYALARTAADRLDIDMPPVYIQQSPMLNAYASGFWGNYYVIVTSAIVDGYSDEELLPIIGHEFTHIKANHVVLTNITQSGVGLMQFTWWLQTIIKYIFSYLSRCQEYTCDRGGLIASGNIQAFVTAFTKLSVGPGLFNRINMMDFYKQALELDKKPFGILGEIELSHPYTVNRIRQAIRFYRSDKYRNFAAMQGKMGTSTLQGSIATGDLMQKIVNKAQGQQMQNQQNPQMGFNQSSSNQSNSSSIQQKPSGFCKKCGTPIKDNARFCVVCGTPYNQTNMQNSPANIQENIIPIVSVEEVAVTTNTKLCPNCGEKLNAEATFCTECGQKL